MDNRIDAIYGRQSIDKKDSISIESQFEFCRYELKGGEAKESSPPCFSMDKSSSLLTVSV